MFLGFTPLNGPMALVLFIFFFLFKVNRFSTVATLPLFKLLYVLGFSSLTDRIGGYLLIDASFLAGFWKWVTSLPILALLDLNNTLVIGGLALSGILCLPVYFLVRLLYIHFIAPRLNKIQELKFVKRIKGYKVINTVIKKMDVVRRKTQS